MNRCFQYLSAALFLFFTASASAITVDGGPAWPGEADVSGISSIGDLGSLSDDTWTYPNIGNSSVENLYFGLGAGWGPFGYSADGSYISSNERFTWYADTATSIEYRGRTYTPYVGGGGSYWTTRLLLTAKSGASVVSDATTQALSDDVHSLFHITGPSFVVQREVQVLYGVWRDANPFLSSWCSSYECYSTGTRTLVNTGFYWENTQVIPVPPALALMASALGGLGFMGWRRRTVL